MFTLVTALSCCRSVRFRIPYPPPEKSRIVDTTVRDFCVAETAGSHVGRSRFGRPEQGQAAWHTGHQNRFRPAIVVVSIGLPQIQQG